MISVCEAKITDGIETKPEPVKGDLKRGSSSVVVRDGNLPEATMEEAAKVLVEHLFAQTNLTIPGISYAVGYKLAEGPTGGDIVDLYRFDNDAVAFGIADISGKGPRAAVGAALILFKQAYIEEEAGALFVGATDGVTEARNRDGEVFGMSGLVEAAVASRNLPEADIVQAIVEATLEFCDSKRRDDVAIATVRFL